MREFKNKKALELYLESFELERIASEIAEQEIAEVGCVLENGSCEIFTQAAGLRVLADEIEDGEVNEDEIDII